MLQKKFERSPFFSFCFPHFCMKLSPSSKVYIAGHRGMVGGALVRSLEAGGHTILTRSHKDLDLCEQQQVRSFYHEEKPDIAIIAAARVGGIHANDTYPAEFLQQNLSIALNAIHEAWAAGVPRVLFLGSSCIYPRDVEQPMREDALLTSPLEKTKEAYAIAKIAGLKMCEHYRRQHGVLFHSAMPSNLYGPGDNYHPNNSHVIPALIRRFHEAKMREDASVTVWGSGKPLREFLHVDDLASAILHLLELDDPPDWVNVGSGQDITIRALAELVAKVVGFEGELIQDSSKPDGTPRKLMDISRIRDTGWEPAISLEAGIHSAYQDFLKGEVREV